MRGFANWNDCANSTTAMAAANLHHDFKEFLRLLNSEKAKYLLLGGYAVNFHGHQRFTGDIDVWISTEPGNAECVCAALTKFGFPPSTLNLAEFQEQGRVFQFGRVPVRIDILTGPSGIEFSDCYSRRVESVFDGVPVPIISLEDLKTNKAASGRPKDLADLAELARLSDQAKPPPAKAKKSSGRRPRQG